MKRNVNERAINGLYHSNRTARAVLQTLAAMPRQDETDLDKLEHKVKDVSRRELVTIFKALDEYGAGEFIPGRRGHASRFRWEVDSVNISTLDVSFPADNAPAPPVSTSMVDFANPTVLINHQFQLRSDLKITVQLPSDITGPEAARLAMFINSLPFTDGTK